MLLPIVIFDIPSSGSGGPLMDWVLRQNIPYVLLVRNKAQTLRLLSNDAQGNVAMHECHPFTTEAVRHILAQLNVLAIGGVLCAVDGLLPIASRIAQQFEAAFVLPEVVDLWCDKGMAREFCRQHDVAVPDFALITSNQIDEIAWSKFPAILKPRRGAGGLGVKRVDSLEDIRRFFSERKDSFNEHFWMIEELLSGAIYSIEGYVYFNEIEVLGISDRTWGPQPHFVEEGVNFPVLQGTTFGEDLIEFTKRLLQESQYHYGFFHIELISTKQGLFLIEFNLRYGGPLPMQIEAAYAVDFYAGLYALCRGQKPDWQEVKYGSSVFYLYPQKTGVLQHIDTSVFERYPEVYLYRMNPNRNIGDNIGRVSSFKDYICLVYVKAENAEISHAIVRALRSEFAEAVRIERPVKIKATPSLTFFGKIKRSIKQLFGARMFKV